MLSRRELIHRTALTTAALELPSCAANADVRSVVSQYPVGALEPVPVVRPRLNWRRFIHSRLAVAERCGAGTGRCTTALGYTDSISYRGVGEEDYVRLSLARGFPYYVDHAAVKGILYLDKDVQKSI